MGCFRTSRHLTLQVRLKLKINQKELSFKAIQINE